MQSLSSILLYRQIVLLAVVLVSMLVRACSQHQPPPPPARGAYPPQRAYPPLPDTPLLPTAIFVAEGNPLPITTMSAGKFLVFGSSGEPTTLDSMNITTGTSLIVTLQIEEPLVMMAPGTLDLVPALAESWEPSNDSTTGWIPGPIGMESFATIGIEE